MEAAIRRSRLEQKDDTVVTISLLRLSGMDVRAAPTYIEAVESNALGFVCLAKSLRIAARFFWRLYHRRGLRLRIGRYPEINSSLFAIYEVK